MIWLKKKMGVLYLMQKIYQILYFESTDKLDEMRKEIEHM